MVKKLQKSIPIWKKVHPDMRSATSDLHTNSHPLHIPRHNWMILVVQYVKLRSRCSNCPELHHFRIIYMKNKN